jgi:hypothetical protein
MPQQFSGDVMTGQRVNTTILLTEIAEILPPEEEGAERMAISS